MHTYKTKTHEGASYKRKHFSAIFKFVYVTIREKCSNLDEGVDKTVSLRPAEEPDGALLDDVVVNPARHGDSPRAPSDYHLGQEKALWQRPSRKERG